MDDQDGPPWARKYQGITLPWDCSLAEVDESMSTVGMIIFKSLEVSSYFAAVAGHSRAPSQKYVMTQPDLSIRKNFDFIIDEQIGKNIYIDIRDIMRKMMVTITSDPTPDSLMSALDSVVCSLHCCDVKKDTEELDVKRDPAPTYSSRAHSRARSRSF